MQHNNDLFRKEAIEGQKSNNLGEAMLLPKTNHQLLSTVLVCWFLLLCALLINANFSSKVTVNGWLVSSKASIDILPKEPTGIIKLPHVSNGQHVSKGQVLLTISRNTSALINQNYQQQVESIGKQHALLEKRKGILENRFQQQESQNIGLQQSYQQHLKVNFDLIQKLQLQLQEASSEEAMLLPLMQSKSIPKQAFTLQKEKRQAIEVQLAQLQSARVEFERNLLSVSQNSSSNKIALEEALNTVASNMQNTNQEIQRLAGASDYNITSPVDGIVHNLQADKGETVGGSSLLMQITPNNNPLKAVLYVPSNHAGFIQQGQLVKLKLNAFPYQKFGMSDAIVSQVSQQILLPHQVKRLPIQLQDPVFLIEAQLDKQQINANGEAVELKAGMLFQANITLSNRSLLEWLLSPILSLRGQF